jgi:hypothetical protein
LRSVAVKALERAVIDGFVAHLARNGHPGIAVERRPDEENSHSADIDAIAGPFAIEHTTVDASPEQRQKESWLGEVIGGLDEECSPGLDCRLRVLLEYEAVQRGQDWPSVRRALKAWLTESAPSLTEGDHIVEFVSGVPFRLLVRKMLHAKRGLVVRVMQPSDVMLANRLRNQLSRKAAKLVRYKEAGRRTILLVESSDLFLMNQCILAEAVLEAFGERTPPGVDQLWYVDTCIPDAFQFIDLSHEPD